MQVDGWGEVTALLSHATNWRDARDFAVLRRVANTQLSF
jgi:hypothetical protein